VFVEDLIGSRMTPASGLGCSTATFFVLISGYSLVAACLTMSKGLTGDCWDNGSGAGGEV